MDASSTKRSRMTRSDPSKSKLETQPHAWPSLLESCRPGVRRDSKEHIFWLSLAWKVCVHDVDLNYLDPCIIDSICHDCGTLTLT